VCSALEFAHRKKDERGRPMLIVHRDVSPQNILISFEGEVKLTDFGIAKAATKASITDAGALRGKLLYMSPEQAWGKPMDRRSDLFSLGIVFYEMCTDQKPFRGGSEMSVLEMVRDCRVAPPSEINPRIPEKLERALLTALAREPEERYQDAAEVARDLRECERQVAAPGTATQPPRTPAAPLAPPPPRTRSPPASLEEKWVPRAPQMGARPHDGPPARA
jgi:serine/threonine protein kinase